MSKPTVPELSPPGGWRVPTGERLPPLAPERATTTQRLLIGVIKKVGKLDAANLWGLLSHNMRLMRGFLFFSSRMMPLGELERRDTELAILRVGWNCRARYEWGQHVDIGMRAGLKAEEVARIAEGPEAPGWLPHQAVLLRACDEFHHDRMVSDSTWALLAERYSERLLLELLMLIGFYEGLAGVLNSTGLPLDNALEKILANAPIHSLARPAVAATHWTKKDST
ncbi:MAG: carboxymuconolactone decarboxylase family protein [Pseudomonadota bacterium]